MTRLIKKKRFSVSSQYCKPVSKNHNIIALLNFTFKQYNYTSLSYLHSIAKLVLLVNKEKYYVKKIYIYENPLELFKLSEKLVKVIKRKNCKQ